MKTIIRHDVFSEWFDNLKDETAKGRIAQRLYRLSSGHAGDVKPVGEGISELRISCGPGYRIYFIQRGPVIIVLLCGGDKSTQRSDIRLAKSLAAKLENS